jgi:hypothetical protein
LTPRGEIWLNGKLVSAPFVLQHGSLVCFGRNATFRYCDPQIVQKTNTKPTGTMPMKLTNGEKSSVHSSLSTLTSNGLKKVNQIDSGTLQVRPAKDFLAKKSSQPNESGYDQRSFDVPCR